MGDIGVSDTPIKSELSDLSASEEDEDEQMVVLVVVVEALLWCWRMLIRALREGYNKQYINNKKYTHNVV